MTSSTRRYFSPIPEHIFGIFQKKMSIISECSSRDVDSTFKQDNQSFFLPDVGEKLEICFLSKILVLQIFFSGHVKIYFDSGSHKNFTLSSKINQNYQIANSFIQIPKNCKIIKKFSKNLTTLSSCT